MSTATTSSRPHPTSIPETLNKYLSASNSHDVVGTGAYVERGAALVTPEAIAALRGLREPLHAKIAGLRASGRLQQRLELLARYFDETERDRHVDAAALRDVTFALLYFLKGFDRVPDTLPEVGLLDDAMVAGVVLHRHLVSLRAHWTRQRRKWPLDA